MVQSNHCKVVSTNAHYYLTRKYFFFKRSQYIMVENPLHKQSEKACMCFKTRWASTRDYMLLLFRLWMLNLKFKSWMDSNEWLCTWNIEWGIEVECLVSGGCLGWPASEQPLGGQQGFDEGNSSLGLLPEINNCYLRNSLRFNKLWKFKKKHTKRLTV